MNRNHKRQKNSILTSLTVTSITVVLLVVLEFALSFFGFGPHIAPELANKYDKFRPDKELIWGLKRNWKGFELNNAPVTTNGFGMRGPEYDGKEKYPILFLGDSVTFGHYIADDQTVPVRLEAGVKQYTNSDVRVFNGGVPGYSTFQMSEYYRAIGRKIKPKLILLGFCLNDVTERYLSLAEYGGEKFFMINVDTTTHLQGVKKVWLNSALRGFIVHLIKLTSKKFEIYNVENLWENPETERIKKAWDRVFSEFDQLVENIEADGAELVVVIYPYRTQVEKKGLRTPQDTLIQYLTKKNIPYLDMLPVFLKENAAPQHIFMDENHLTPFGAEMTAYYIHDFFIKNNIIPVSRPGKQN